MPDDETWRFINTFAPWLSAIGTLAAVITSLWLAQRDRYIRLSVRAALTIRMISGGGPGHGDRLVSVTVTNKGRRTATLSCFGWHIGWLKRLDFIGLKRVEFLGPDHEGTPLPAKLEDGDYATFSVPLDQFAAALLNGLPKHAFFPCPSLRLRAARMQAIVATTAGQTFYATINKDLRQELARRAENKWR